MRIRQVKPAFFKDAKVAELPAAVRLFYIGLWMLADDAGYYRWDVSEAALELYGFESRAKREKNAEAYLAALVTAGRVVRFDDCTHIRVPTLVDHQRFAGETKRVYTYKKEHERCSPQTPAGARGSPPIPDPVRLGNGSERFVSSDAQARENDERPAPGAFKAKIAEYGGPKA